MWSIVIVCMMSCVTLSHHGPEQSEGAAPIAAFAPNEPECRSLAAQFNATHAPFLRAECRPPLIVTRPRLETPAPWEIAPEVKARARRLAGAAAHEGDRLFSQPLDPVAEFRRRNPGRE